MKKIVLLLLVAALACAGFAGCQKGEPAAPPAVTDPQPEPPAVTDPQPEPPTPDESKQEVTLYLPNEMADGFDELSCTADPGPEGIVEALIANGALPEGVAVNSFTPSAEEDQPLVLDVSAEFSEALLSTGTAGESMYLGSLVNTFLKAYDAQTITVTCDGSVLETGHAIYDQPLEFYDLTPIDAPAS